MSRVRTTRVEPPSRDLEASASDVLLLTASEVAEYTFCPEAWYLRRHQAVPSPEDARRLEHGAAAHRALGRTTDRIRLVTTVRQVLLLAMVLVGLLLLAQLAGLANR